MLLFACPVITNKTFTMKTWWNNVNTKYQSDTKPDSKASSATMQGAQMHPLTNFPTKYKPPNTRMNGVAQQYAPDRSILSDTSMIS